MAGRDTSACRWPEGDRAGFMNMAHPTGHPEQPAAGRLRRGTRRLQGSPGSRPEYTVAYPLTKEFPAPLKAPVNGFHAFDHSAHRPLFAKPDRVVKILREDVLPGTAALANP